MKKLKIVAVIPARMGSNRFPGKPLTPILGIPMIEHVRRRLERVKMLDAVYVATCDEEIKDVVEKFGGKAIMTSPDHQRATDRIAEAAQHFDADVIINAQGDEPMILPESIELVCNPFLVNPELICSCLVYPIRDEQELKSLNTVKAVLSKSQKILYLSRSPIPGHAYKQGFSYYKQSGIMAFTRSSLQQFVTLQPTPLEIQESVDLMRLLEHDLWVQGVVTKLETQGVDVPDQVKQVEKEILENIVQLNLFNSIKDGV